MILGVCYHLNGNTMAKDFKPKLLPALIELLSETKSKNKIKSDNPSIENSK